MFCKVPGIRSPFCVSAISNTDNIPYMIIIIITIEYHASHKTRLT